MNEIEIKTRDGARPSYVYQPTGGEPCPALLVLIDGVGILRLPDGTLKP